MTRMKRLEGRGNKLRGDHVGMMTNWGDFGLLVEMRDGSGVVSPSDDSKRAVLTLLEIAKRRV